MAESKIMENNEIYSHNVPPSYQPNYNEQRTVYNPQLQQGVINASYMVDAYNHPQIVYFAQNPQVLQQFPDKPAKLKYSKYHFGFGILSIVLGVIIIIIDPLLPILLFYPYSIVVAGVLMIISGSLSICGSNSINKCCLIVAMILDIIASVNLFVGLCVGIWLSQVTYNNSLYSLSIFNIIFCIICFKFVIWDSGLKCGEVCCGNRNLRENPQTLCHVQTIPTFNNNPQS